MSGKDTVKDILDGIYPKEAFEEIMGVETMLIANKEQDLFYIVFNHIQIDESDPSGDKTVETLLYLMFAYRYDLIIPMFSDASGQPGKINMNPSKNRPIFTKVSVSNAFRKKYGQTFDWVQNENVLKVGTSASFDGIGLRNLMLNHRGVVKIIKKDLIRIPNLNPLQLEQLRKIEFEILAINYKISLLDKVKKESKERVTSLSWRDIFTDIFEDNEFMEFTGFKVEISGFGIFQTSFMDLDKWADYLYRKELYSTHAYLIKKYAWVLQDDVFDQSSYLILGKSGDFYHIPKRKVDYGFDIKNPTIVSDSKILKYYEPIYYTSKQLDFDLKDLFKVILAKGDDDKFDGVPWLKEIEIAKLLLHHVIYLDVEVANFAFYLIEQLQNEKIEFGSIVDGTSGEELNLQDMLKEINPYINLNLQIPKFVKSTKTIFTLPEGFGLDIPSLPEGFGLDMPPPPLVLSGEETEEDLREDPKLTVQFPVTEESFIPVKPREEKRKKKKRKGTVGKIIDALTVEGRYQSAMLGRQHSSSVWGTLRKWIRKAIVELKTWKDVNRNFRTRLDLELVDKTSSLNTYDFFFRGLLKILELLYDKKIKNKKIRRFIEKFMDAVDEHDKSETKTMKLERHNKEKRVGLQTEVDELEQKVKEKKQELDKLKKKQEKKVEKRKNKLKRKRKETIDEILELKSLQPEKKKIKISSRVVFRNVMLNNNKKKGTNLSFPCMNCGKPARMVCSKCQNVAYCGLKCFNSVEQEDHALLHHNYRRQVVNVNMGGKVFPESEEIVIEESRRPSSHSSSRSSGSRGSSKRHSFLGLVETFPKNFANFMEDQGDGFEFIQREARDSLFSFLYLFIPPGFLLKLFMSLQNKSQILLTAQEKFFLPRMKHVLEDDVIFNENNVNHMIQMGIKEKQLLDLFEMRKQALINELGVENESNIKTYQGFIRDEEALLKKYRRIEKRSIRKLRIENNRVNKLITKIEDEMGFEDDPAPNIDELQKNVDELRKKNKIVEDILGTHSLIDQYKDKLRNFKQVKIDTSDLQLYENNYVLVDKLIEMSILNPSPYKKLYKFLLNRKSMFKSVVSIGIRNISEIDDDIVDNVNAANAVFADSNSVFDQLVKYNRGQGRSDHTFSVWANDNKALLFSIIRGKNDRVKQVLNSSEVSAYDPKYIPLAIATYLGHTNMVKLFLDGLLDIDELNRDIGKLQKEVDDNKDDAQVRTSRIKELKIIFKNPRIVLLLKQMEKIDNLKKNQEKEFNKLKSKKESLSNFKEWKDARIKIEEERFELGALSIQFRELQRKLKSKIESKDDFSSINMSIVFGAMWGRDKIIKSILNHKKLRGKINPGAYKNQALWMAVKYGNLSTVKLIIGRTGDWWKGKATVTQRVLDRANRTGNDWITVFLETV